MPAGSCRAGGRLAGSYSSARSPTSLRMSSSRSNSSRASSIRPCRASTSASQNEHGRKTPSPAGRPSTAPSAARAIAEHEPVDRQLPANRLDGRDERGRRRGGRNPTSGITRTLASSSSESYDWVKAPLRRRSTPARVPPPRSRPSEPRQRSTGPSRPNSSWARTARSNATHAITFEWVKCRYGPRTSQMPASGWRQPSSSHSSSFAA